MQKNILIFSTSKWQKHPVDAFLARWMALHGLSHLLQPAWVCTAAPGDWWVGKGSRNLSPGYSAALVMDGPLEVLAELMGHERKRASSWEAEDGLEIRGWWCCWERGRSKRKSKNNFYIVCINLLFFFVWKSYTSFFFSHLYSTHSFMVCSRYSSKTCQK